jgi:hypothetical protein
MFRTEIPAESSTLNIDIKSSILSIGSCFANDIGQHLHDHKFDIMINPGGILFNPISIFELMEMAMDEHIPNDNTFLNHEGIFLNHKLHSEVNATSKEELLKQIQNIQEQLKNRLQKAEVIILTFGTAWVYKLKSDNTIVANCHKVPQKQFEKVLLTKEEIIGHFNKIRTMVLKFNPDIRFLLTVSPIRHIKDTLSLNSVSKATLRLACHELQETCSETSYFPSYELMMDDLRDYRFYKSDMLHPTEQAVDYVWQKFVQSCLHERAVNFVDQWAKLKKAIDHKPFHPASKAHQSFLKDLIQKIENLSPLAEVSHELALLKSQLI